MKNLIILLAISLLSFNNLNAQAEKNNSSEEQKSHYFDIIEVNGEFRKNLKLTEFLRRDSRFNNFTQNLNLQSDIIGKFNNYSNALSGSVVVINRSVNYTNQSSSSNLNFHETPNVTLVSNNTTKVYVEGLPIYSGPSTIFIILV